MKKKLGNPFAVSTNYYSRGREKDRKTDRQTDRKAWMLSMRRKGHTQQSIKAAEVKGTTRQAINIDIF